jgi:glycosyltransferase involved in cell wall biosynthesis
VQIGDRRSLKLIESVNLPTERGGGRAFSALIRKCAEAAEEGLRRRLEEVESDPASLAARSTAPVLVQVVLNPNPQTGGSASVGGVLTFLHSIGDALGTEGTLGRVITLEVLPRKVAESASTLVEKRTGRHSILRVPVYALSDVDPEQLMIHETEIRRSVALALRNRGIDPDLIHIRYTDNLAKAMLVLAGRWQSRLIFTLTADPHRDFAAADGELLPMSEEQTLFNQNKVFVADTILENAAGILGIAHGSVDAQLLTYFPKLCLSPEIQRKPVRVIPEGIRLEPQDRPVDDAEQGSGRGILSMLASHPGRFALDQRYSKNPVILNVGRLVPAKGQHRLVEAWARSPLNRDYNLVLIGGNMNHPTAEEVAMLLGIERTLNRFPRLTGRFCHIPAQPNNVIRGLERALVESSDAAVPVYLCSSLKEEFGISILEAMAAGFLVLAPIRGGVPTYLEHGQGGFLIDTATADTIREAAERILLSQPAERLWEIARQGRRFIVANFGIQTIAARFADFYAHVYAHNRAANAVHAGGEWEEVLS